MNSALSVQPPDFVPAAGEVRVLVAEWPPLVEVLRADPPLLPEDEPLVVELERDRLVPRDVFEVADWADELAVDRLLLDRLLLDRLLLDRLLPDRLLPERLPLDRPLERAEPVERLVDRELADEVLDRLVAPLEPPLSLDWLPQMSPEGNPPMRFAT